MTRINSAIKVERLTDEHLLAEHRKLTMVPYFLRKSIESGSITHIPEKFTLGTRHILFFVDKMGFLNQRYQEVHKECLSRGFKVNDMSYKFIISKEYNKFHTPTKEEYDILIDRISSRIMTSSKKYWHYRGKQLTKKEAINILKNKPKQE